MRPSEIYFWFCMFGMTTFGLGYMVAFFVFGK